MRKYSKLRNLLHVPLHFCPSYALLSPVDPQEVLEHIEMPAAVYEQLPALRVPRITSTSPIDALPAVEEILVITGQGGK